MTTCKTEDAYRNSLSSAPAEAGSAEAAWNTRYIVALYKRGLVLSSTYATGDGYPFGGAYLAPVPVRDRDEPVGWTPAYIVWA